LRRRAFVPGANGVRAVSAPLRPDTAVCVVCLGATRPGLRCGVCAWPPPDPGLTGFQDAARAFDHAAAVRVARARGSKRVPDDIRVQVRYGPVPVDATVVDVGPEAERGRAAALTVLTALSARELDLLLFVEIGTRWLSTQWVRFDERGFVDAPAAHWGRLTWRQVVPWLPTDDAARDLVLAGGVGLAPPNPTIAGPGRAVPTEVARATLAAHFERALGDLRTDALVRARKARSLVLIERCPDWTWCALAADALREAVPPVAVLRGGAFADESVQLPDLVRELALDVPARHAVHLVSADPRPGDPAAKRHDLLLARGAIAGSARRPLAEITLATLGAGPAGEELTVVVADWDDPYEWTVLDRSTVAAPPGEATLSVRMTRPDRVEFTGERGAWEYLEYDDVPRVSRVGPAPREEATPRPWLPRSGPRCDVVLAVELGGHADEIAARLRFTRELLAEMARPGADAVWGRAAVVGYRDLPVTPPGEWADDDPVAHVDFTTPAQALAAIAGWVGGPVRDPYAAPLDRVVPLLRASALAWDADPATLMITVGRRGPHPQIQADDPARACGDTPWEDDLTRCRAERGLRHILVLDDPGFARSLPRAAHERTLRAWRRFGEDGCFTLERTRPRDLLRFGHVVVAGGTVAPMLVELVGRERHSADAGHAHPTADHDTTTGGRP